MINSKGIKILCYIVMGLIIAVSLFLVIFGISQLADKNTSGVIWLVLAIALPLVVTVSLYPIFALANIDENLLRLNQKVDRLLIKKDMPKEEKASASAPVVQQVAPVVEPISRTSQTSKTNSMNKVEEAINYINVKYNLQISIDDDCETIQRKIDAVEEGGFTGIALRRKVLEATTKEEIINIFIMHKVAYS